jgi:DNA-binding NarL/FixJ family response regulator
MGIHGFVDKHSKTAEALAKAITAVEGNCRYFSPVYHEVIAKAQNDPLSPHKTLSEHERKVLGLIGASWTNEQIGAFMDLKACTVQSRRRDIQRKLDIHSTGGLMLYAIQQGFTRADNIPAPPAVPAKKKKGRSK